MVLHCPCGFRCYVCTLAKSRFLKNPLECAICFLMGRWPSQLEEDRKHRNLTDFGSLLVLIPTSHVSQ